MKEITKCLLSLQHAMLIEKWLHPNSYEAGMSVGFFRYTQSSKEWGDKNDFFIKAAKNLDVLKGA